MKKILFNLLVISAPFFFVTCVNEEPKPETFSHYANFDFDRGLFNTQTIIEGNDAHSGTKYSRATTGNNFGIGFSYSLPDSLKGKQVYVSVNAWTRTGDVANANDIILSLTKNDSILLWVNCNFREFLKNANEWTDCKRIISLPSNLTDLDNVFINVMAHNIDAKTYFDVDDLSIRYFESDSLTNSN